MSGSTEERTLRYCMDKDFFICANQVFRLPLLPLDKLTYIALARYAGPKNMAWPSYNTLARDVGCSRRRVIDAVARLIKCNLVFKEQRMNRSNIFKLSPPQAYWDRAAFAAGAANLEQAAGDSPQNTGPENNQDYLPPQKLICPDGSHPPGEEDLNLYFESGPEPEQQFEVAEKPLSQPSPEETGNVDPASESIKPLCPKITENLFLAQNAGVTPVHLSGDLTSPPGESTSPPGDLTSPPR